MHAIHLFELLDLSICTESGEITVKRFEFGMVRVVIDVVGQRKKATQDPGLFPQMSDPKSQIWAQNVRGFWYKKCPYADRVGPGGPKNVLFSDICSNKSQKFSKNSQTSF